MNPTEQLALKRLLDQARVACLSVVVGDEPYTSLVPFAMDRTYDGIFIHVSTLARHSAGLAAGGRYSLLVHAPDSPDADPLQLPRATFQGLPERLDRGSEAYRSGKSIFLEKIPTSSLTFGLGDFHLYRLVIANARYVAGFARAYSPSLAALRALAGLA
jgi:putative heme iron utilization protein